MTKLTNIENMLRGEISRLKSRVGQCCGERTNTQHCDSYGCSSMQHIEKNLRDILIAVLNVPREETRYE
jgi:hypothetical protein